MGNLKLLLSAAVGVAVLVLPGCAAFESMMVDTGVADQLLANDVISPEQHAALTGNGWGEILKGVVNTASTLLIGVPIMRVWRGPATKQENVEKKKAAKASPAPAQ